MLRNDARTYVVRGVIENGRRLRRIAVTEANRGVEEWYRPSSFSIPSSSFRGLPETAAETWEFIALRLADFRFLPNQLVVGNSAPSYDDTNGDSINIYGDATISPLPPVRSLSFRGTCRLELHGTKRTIASRSAARLTSILTGSFCGTASFHRASPIRPGIYRARGNYVVRELKFPASGENEQLRWIFVRNFVRFTTMRFSEA